MTAYKPVTQSQGVLLADVQAAIDTILRMPWDAQGTFVSLLMYVADQRECEQRLLAQLGAGGGK